MSSLSEDYLKIIKDIEKHISNKEEKEYILNKVYELSYIYMNLIDRITQISSTRLDDLEEYQDRLEAQLDRVKKSVAQIRSDIYEDEDYDLEIVCPYCNHEFFADVEEEDEVECPECHNIIELDWDEDDEDDDCNGCCASCGHHEYEDDESQKNDSKTQDDDDEDM